MASNNILRVAVIGGDGTGPEVAAEGVKVLTAAAALECIKVELKNFDFGGERYLRTGEIFPPGAVEELRTFPAILLGAVGHPDVAAGVMRRALRWCDARTGHVLRRLMPTPILEALKARRR